MDSDEDADDRTNFDRLARISAVAGKAQLPGYIASALYGIRGCVPVAQPTAG